MVCIVLTELIKEHGPKFQDKIYAALRELLPESLTSNKDLTIERLVGMQSGLRDYWALTALWGATPQDRFSIYQDAPEALKRLGKFHFAPGTQMSYCNSNFVAIGLAIEKASGQPLGDLLRRHLFEPAGMKTASLLPDTNRIPAPLVGYEGSESAGYIPYVNRIEWAGDAGIMASLEDMIAYEQYVHRNAKVVESAYHKNAQDPKYIDGKAAYYGYGLVHGDSDGAKTKGHSGGLAGFRLRRIFVPSAQLSLIILLNSEADGSIPDTILKKLLQTSTDGQAKPTAPASTAEVKWTGQYLDPEAQLGIVVDQPKPGVIDFSYSRRNERLKVDANDPNKASSKDMSVTFSPENNNITIIRNFENRTFTARPLSMPKSVPAPSVNASTYIGKYYSSDIDSTLHVTGSGAALYGAFDGYLGKGPIHVMRWLGEDVWWLACFRSLDAPAPGNWTMVFDRDGGGKVKSVTVGCWLARMIEYERVE